MLAGKPVEACRRHPAGSALAVVELDLGVQGGEGHGHVRGMGGDAVRGVAEDGVVAVHSVAGGAAGTRFPLVAGLGHVLEVRATGALEEVPAGGGDVAQLPGRAGEEGLGQGGVAGPDEGVHGQISVGYTGFDPEPSGGQFPDVVERQPGEVDEGVGGLHVVLHEVDQVGAAADVAGAGVARVGGRRFLEAGGPYVGEGLHAITSGVGGGVGGGVGVRVGVRSGVSAAAQAATASAIPL